jgi:hypothetical protein
MNQKLLEPEMTTAIVPQLDAPMPVVAKPGSMSDSTANVLRLIDAGMKTGLTPDALEKLVGLYERVMAKDAEAAFTRAKKAFQSACPVIGKNKTANLGQGKASYSYADLEHITVTIRPLLEEHGFTYSFSQSHNGDIVSVTCILKHEAGHEESTTFAGPWATNAGMSAIQKYASATTFCQRYALRLALGLPVGEDDEVKLAHDNPAPKADAPKPRSRGQAAVTKDQLTAIIGEWKTRQQGEPSRDDFAKWARSTVGSEEWNPNKFDEWTNSFAATCRDALEMP